MKPTTLFFLVSLALTAAVPGNTPRHAPPAGPIRQYSWEQLVARYPGTFFYRGPAQAKKVALTFDDGPDDRVTPQILDILKENSVPGTFFLLGSQARRHPDMVRRIAAEGNIIANHTWSHRNLVNQTPGQVQQEIERTAELLEQLTGLRPALVRSPWGKVSAGAMDLARRKGWRVIGWSADSLDWRDAQAARVLANLRPQIHPGGIILLHAIAFPASREVTVKVLPVLITQLKAEGYHMVTVDDLLHIDAYKPAGQGRSQPASSPAIGIPAGLGCHR